jgi:hypothetical protein
VNARKISATPSSKNTYLKSRQPAPNLGLNKSQQFRARTSMKNDHAVNLSADTKAKVELPRRRYSNT